MEAFTVPVLVGAALGWRKATVLALALASATILGGIMGVFLGATILPTLSFAAGAGSVAVALLWLAQKTRPDARHAVAMLVGVLAVYVAGLLHEI